MLIFKIALISVRSSAASNIVLFIFVLLEQSNRILIECAVNQYQMMLPIIKQMFGLVVSNWMQIHPFLIEFKYLLSKLLSEMITEFIWRKKSNQDSNENRMRRDIVQIVAFVPTTFNAV